MCVSVCVCVCGSVFRDEPVIEKWTRVLEVKQCRPFLLMRAKLNVCNLVQMERASKREREIQRKGEKGRERKKGGGEL